MKANPVPWAEASSSFTKEQFFKPSPLQQQDRSKTNATLKYKILPELCHGCIVLIGRDIHRQPALELSGELGLQQGQVTGVHFSNFWYYYILETGVYCVRSTDSVGVDAGAVFAGFDPTNAC